MRLSEITNGNVTEMFSGNPKPSAGWSFIGKSNLTMQSIEQNDLGDCYYLSSLAEWARYPNRWKQFARGYNPSLGYATFRYYVGGDIVYITVDDNIPFQD